MSILKFKNPETGAWEKVGIPSYEITPESIGAATVAQVEAAQSSADSKVPTSRTINGKALSSDITLSASDLGAATVAQVEAAQSSADSKVPNTRTVNNKQLNEDVTLTAADVGAVAKTGDTMAGDLIIPVDANLKFWSSDKYGYFIKDDGTRLIISDHDSHELMSFGYNQTPEAFGGIILHTGNSNMTRLVSSDTTPTVNNEINWTYG